MFKEEKKTFQLYSNLGRIMSRKLHDHSVYTAFPIRACTMSEYSILGESVNVDTYYLPVLPGMPISHLIMSVELSAFFTGRA